MLREVWMNNRVEKSDTHEDIIIKTLLDSGATGMFMDKRMVARHGFKLQKLERSIVLQMVTYLVCDWCFDTLKGSKMQS